MSRRPALGKGYTENEQNKRYHENTLSTSVVIGGIPVHMPRYYRDRIFSRYQKEEIRKKNETKIIENSIKNDNWIRSNYQDMGKGILETKEAIIRRTKQKSKRNKKL